MNKEVVALRKRLEALEAARPMVFLALCGDGSAPCDTPGMEMLRGLFVIGRSTTEDRESIDCYVNGWQIKDAMLQAQRQLEVDLMDAERRAAALPEARGVLTEMPWDPISVPTEGT